MPLAFHSALPVTVTATGSDSATVSIDLTGLLGGDFVFGAYCAMADLGPGPVSWSAPLSDSLDVGVPSIANFGGYATGHTFYAVYNGTDTTYTMDFVDPGFYAELIIACVACAYRGGINPTILPLAAPTSGGEESFVYPGSSFTSSHTLTPANADDLLITAQVLPGTTTAGTVSSPYTLRASAVGAAFGQDVHERTISDSHYRGISLTGSLYPQAQIADLTGVTTAQTPTWTNATGSGWTTRLDSSGNDTGIPVEGVGMAHWLITHGGFIHIWHRL